ncbi:MAG: response regulator [Wenzhouxiangellaceae bacterium]|nr:response regulator [Wenzhouxiangellaceae bacterium]
MRILLAEDDELLGEGVAAALSRRGFRVDWCRDGILARNALETGSFSLVILDLGLPRFDGIRVLEWLRMRGHTVPVIVLTARDSIEDRVAGLDAGADDYLVKPFSLDELLARIRALLRRGQGRAVNELSISGLKFLPQQFQAFLGKRDLGLSVREFQVLMKLATKYPETAEKKSLERLMYGWDSSGSANAIEVHIHNLRRKLSSDWIETRRGVGYRLRPPDE